MTTTLTPAAAAFLDAVRSRLADLPHDVLTDLMDDVEQHLAEVLAEGSIDDLGTPSEYAAELRSAAGLPAREDDPDGWALVRAVRRRHARFAETRAYREVRAFLPELRPAWWVARGYLLVVLLARLTHSSMREVLPIPHVSGNALLGVVAVGAAVVASVKWARRGRLRRGWQRTGAVVVNGLAVVTAFVVMADVSDGIQPSYDAYYYTTQPEGVYGPYGQITDVRPFDEKGNALEDVQLYDQDGNPLANQICDRSCKRLTFPLHRPPFDEPHGYPMATLAPTPTVESTPTASPPPSATPSTTPSTTPGPTRSVTPRR